MRNASSRTGAAREVRSRIDFSDLALAWARATCKWRRLGRRSKLVSSTAVETTVGTLENFQHAHFESTGEIPERFGRFNGGLRGPVGENAAASLRPRAPTSFWLMGFGSRNWGRKGQSGGTWSVIEMRGQHERPHE